MSLYIILMGVQGAGKGEQARVIQETYGIPQVSTGDLFRAMKTRTDALAQKIQQIMAEGKLIDDDTTNAVVEDRLGQDDAKNGVIFDGYPRTPVQAAWLDQYLDKQGAHVNAVLLLELDFYTAFKRSFGRVKSDASGKTYNIYFNDEGINEWKFVDHPQNEYPPKLHAVESTGGVLSRRPDDANAHAILKRIDTFRELTAPLITYYEQKRPGLLVRIDADQSIEAVSAAVKAAIDARK
ncbi:MAG: nucleoside monophosphate kinase [Anaerolineae bacterium]|nr:nucleoside monophosphate kinase [Anaerolineae bacterium]MCA9908094.1 nucleoside monophosphate kinase [Anaerolineae bacterium]